jgi:hypothetical protein
LRKLIFSRNAPFSAGRKYLIPCASYKREKIAIFLSTYLHERPAWLRLSATSPEHRVEVQVLAQVSYTGLVRLSSAGAGAGARRKEKKSPTNL